MKKLIKTIGMVILILVINRNAISQKHFVSSITQFDSAMDMAMENDSIIWEPGNYEDVYMNIEKSNLVIIAKIPGETKFTGASRVNIKASYITLEGFQFIDGDIGTKNVIETTGSYNVFSHLNIKDYTSYKYLVINEECQYNTVSYCNFENRINLDDKNILSVLVDEFNPGYHIIKYCSFKNFEGTGGDLGIEPIRIGLSTQADYKSRTVVEYCYFTQCNGDGEIISNKAEQNVFRYNTFEDNPRAELVLRHGDEAVVYGNFFINNYGGIRIREGKGHIIFNNYFTNLQSRSVYLQNDDSDPLDSILIAFNTFIHSAKVILGGSGNFKPKNVILANNIFSEPNGDLFTDATTTESWIGNISFGQLGIERTNGITEMDPLLEVNAKGYYILSAESPAIDAAQSGYPELKEYPGIQYDHTIEYDLMNQSRPIDISMKDIGCHEYPHNVTVEPMVGKNNTGPSYLSDTGTTGLSSPKKRQLSVYPNPVNNELSVSFELNNDTVVIFDVFDVSGRKVKAILNDTLSEGHHTIVHDVSALQEGIYLLQMKEKQKFSNIVLSSGVKFIKE